MRGVTCFFFLLVLALLGCPFAATSQPIATTPASPATTTTAANPWHAAARAQAAAQEQMMQMAMMRAREREMATMARTQAAPASSIDSTRAAATPAAAPTHAAAPSASALLFDAQPPFNVEPEPFGPYNMDPYRSLYMEPVESSSSSSSPPLDSSPFDSTPLDVYAPSFASPYDALLDDQLEAEAEEEEAEEAAADQQNWQGTDAGMPMRVNDDDAARTTTTTIDDTTADDRDDYSTVRGTPLSWRRRRITPRMPRNPRTGWSFPSRLTRTPRTSRTPRISRFITRCADTQLEATGTAVRLVSSDRAEVRATIEVREEPSVLDPALPHLANATSWSSNSTFLTELATAVQQRLADLAVLVFAELNTTASPLAASAHVHQLRTLSVLLEPIYEYRDSRQYLRGYRASTAFAFRSDASRAGEMIARITRVGVTRVDSVLFKASARSVQRGRESVLRAATADALSQHEQMVQAMALVKSKAKGVKKGVEGVKMEPSTPPTFTSRVMSARVQSLSPPVADTTADDDAFSGAHAGYDFAQPLARLSAFASAGSSSSSSSSSSSLLYSTLPIFPSDALLRANVVVRACVRFQ